MLEPHDYIYGVQVFTVQRLSYDRAQNKKGVEYLCRHGGVYRVVLVRTPSEPHRLTGSSGDKTARPWFRAIRRRVDPMRPTLPWGTTVLPQSAGKTRFARQKPG